MEATHAAIAVSASPAAVMDVIADLPNYPLWSDGVVSAQITQREADGRPRRGRLRMSVGTITEDFELQYQWHGDESVEWEMVSGGLISALHGRYTCTDNGDGTTTVGYDLSLELTVPMIGTLRQRGERHILRSALRGLRRRVNETAAETQP
jgi:ribosome-associated toxin RatA of RatAB toxin-antitoxin module